MKKVLFLTLIALVAIFAYREEFKSVPADANVYVVDYAVQDNDEITFYLRDVDSPIVVPVVNCLNGVDYPAGTIITVNDDFMVEKVYVSDSLFEILLVLATSMLTTCIMYFFYENKKNNGQY